MTGNQASDVLVWKGRGAEYRLEYNRELFLSLFVCTSEREEKHSAQKNTQTTKQKKNKTRANDFRRETKWRIRQRDGLQDCATNSPSFFHDVLLFRSHNRPSWVSFPPFFFKKSKNRSPSTLASQRHVDRRRNTEFRSRTARVG